MSAIVDPSISHWQVEDPDALLGALLDVFLARRICDKLDGDGMKSQCLASVWNTVPKITFRFPSKRAMGKYLALPELTVGDIATGVQLNWERTDHCSVRTSSVMSQTADERKHLVAYVLTRCAGRKFIDCVHRSQ